GRSPPHPSRSTSAAAPSRKTCVEPRRAPVNYTPQTTYEENQRHAPSHQICREGLVDRPQRRLASFLEAQQDQPEPVGDAAVVGQTAAEVASEDKTAAWLAPS